MSGRKDCAFVRHWNDNATVVHRVGRSYICKVVSVHAMEACGEVELQLHLFLTLALE